MVDRVPHLNHFVLNVAPVDSPQTHVEFNQLNYISNVQSKIFTAAFLSIPKLTTLICESFVQCLIAFLKSYKQLQSLAFHLPPFPPILDGVPSDIAMDLSLESLVSLYVITEKSTGIKKIILNDFSELAGKTFSVFTYVVCVLVLILMYS